MRTYLLPLAILLTASSAATQQNCNISNQNGNKIYQCPACVIHLDNNKRVTLLQGALCQNYKVTADSYADSAVVQLPGCQRTVSGGKVVNEQGATCKTYAEKPWVKTDQDDPAPPPPQGSSAGSSFTGSSSSSSFSNGNFQSVQTVNGQTTTTTPGCRKVTDQQGNILSQEGPNCGGGSKASKAKKLPELPSQAHAKQKGKCAEFSSADGSKIKSCPGCTEIVNSAGKVVKKTGAGCKKSGDNDHKKNQHSEKQKEEEEEEDEDDWDEDDFEDDDDFDYLEEKKGGSKKQKGSKSSKKHHDLRDVLW
ncbi:hypothetical protein MMC10_000348 [Thelotrema lepadinum]|nr:hypothetical protein [Thelotrema lepadinum]